MVGPETEDELRRVGESSCSPAIPQPRRLWSFTLAYETDGQRASGIPQPEGCGSFTLAYKAERPSPFPESPNRQVVDLSVQPTRNTRRAFLESHNRKVVDLSL